ncbi:MAG TPA: VOC family protein [Anaerolineaceae bacterium]|nr:VOC family protein [Anaerolineaceae bacterium]
MSVKYVHTNLIARSWQRLAAFYQDVFGCLPVPPQRDLSGDWLVRATGVPGAHLQGVHLRLPGWGDGGPTLEIFQYEPEAERLPPAANRPGFGHIAFEVADIQQVIRTVEAAGGGRVGEVAQRTIAGAGRIEFAYLTDPEGNIIEVQKWYLEGKS